MSLIYGPDIVRFHTASRMIEDDLNEAYHTCRAKYGADVAGSLLVAKLREKLNDKPDQWPPPENLQEKVNDALRRMGLLE